MGEKEKGQHTLTGTVTNAANMDTTEQVAEQAKEKEKARAKDTKKENPPVAVNKRKTKTNGNNKEKNGTAEVKKSAGRSKTFVKFALKMTTSAR